MKNFPRFTGRIIPDMVLVLIFSTCFFLLIGYFICGEPDGYPSADQAKPVLYFTFSLTLIYGILYWISRNAQGRNQ
jgi:hypothetical protein